MNIEVSSVNAFARRVNVTIPAARVNSEFDKAYREVGKRARLSGFRKGKVPRSVLEAQFGPKVREDVATLLIQEAYSAALGKHALTPVSRPALLEQGDLKDRADFSFAIGVEVRPEVVAQSYKGLSVFWPRWELTEQEVDAAVERARLGQRRLALVTDRAVELGDRVQVELKVSDGDTVVVTEPGTMVHTARETWLKGLGDSLIGLTLEQSFTGAVTFADDARNKDVAGRELQVELKVLSIQAEVVPELEQFAIERGHADVAALRAATHTQLAGGREENARNMARANLLQALIEGNPFDVPAGMVEENLQLLMSELRMQESHRGRDPRSVTFSDAQIADLRQRSAFAAKGALLLESITQLEGLSVSDEEIEAKYVELAAERGQTVEAVKGYFVKDGAVEELRQRMLEEKTLDWLLSHAVVSHEAAPVVEAAAAEAAPAVEASAEAEAPAPKRKRKSSKAAAPSDESETPSE
jgi:trigger factor